MEFSPVLHGLRGLAALGVLVFHWAMFFPAMTRWLAGIRWGPEAWMNLSLPVVSGWQGVPVFFVLSAYLLTGQWHMRPMGMATVQAFWRRRFLRIYPALWLELAVLTVASGWVAGLLPAHDAGMVALNALLWINLPPTMTAPLVGVWWTLPVEFMFYLLLPLLVAWQRRWGWLAVVVACFVMSIAWRAGVLLRFPGENLASRLHIVDALPGSLATFAAGIAIANAHWKLGRPQRLAALLAIAAAYLGLQAWLWTNDATYLRGHWMLAVWIPALAVVIALGIAVLVRSPSATGTLGCRPMVWLGEVSFGIYLWHYPVLQAMALAPPAVWDGLSGSLLALAVCLLATLALATLSFRLVEAPLMGWGRAEPRRTPCPAQGCATTYDADPPRRTER